MYLATPKGDGAGGGTEFTRLTRDGRPVVVDPEPGNALVWPNFGQWGSWSGDSLHRALPLKGKGASRKLVVNLWWEGGARVGTGFG